MRQGTIVTDMPVGHPLSVAEAKRQLRIEQDDTDQDDHIADLCAAAHRKAERDIGYPILRQTRETHLSDFPRAPIWLGGGDAPEVVSIRYRGSDNQVQNLAATEYVLDAVSRPAQVFPANGSWPRTAGLPGSVVIEWRAGWDDANDVPDDLLQAMKLIVGHWFLYREAVLAGTVSSDVEVALDNLLSPFRQHRVF
ncbi:head-tail connector protein [Tsuneonella suprasediminis]|uniref:head-tail connector protein n=1 Tax=Tsuneonella suprasediminis TaxID=2306996 RepID=UPI002F941A69